MPSEILLSITRWHWPLPPCQVEAPPPEAHAAPQPPQPVLDGGTQLGVEVVQVGCAGEVLACAGVWVNRGCVLAEWGGGE